ncbi:MAG: outer membrane beta-barrel protein, partial [Thermogutta sp.]|uniref:outer membrane beta-barrel protein n=1 Tax=Thermogutta sp. TaxID=1962930 RepID=UPI001987AB28
MTGKSLFDKLAVVCLCFGLSAGSLYAQVYPTSWSGQNGAACVPGCNTCGTCDGGGFLSDFFYCDPCRPTDPWKLPTPGFLERWGFEFGGWVGAGISVVANNPADNYNGVVTFNDRDQEFQMNQLNLYLERQVNNGGYGWDWGGRVDVLYGTDARFTQAIDGLESDWNQTERFYQVALPQFYFDVAYNSWTLRGGHFYTPVGYEAVPVTQNFFYSHSYSHQYGQPFTNTGLLLSRSF